MSNYFRDAIRTTITPTAGVPAYPANALSIQKYYSQISVSAEITPNGATGIKHTIWGFIQGANAPIVIQTLVNLETVPTLGKYVIQVPPPPVGGIWSGIAVQQEVAAGGPPATVVRAAIS